MRVLFAGTPEAALPTLEALLASKHDVVGVLTRADARQGRGRTLHPSPVAVMSRDAGLDVRTPATLKGEHADDVRDWLRDREELPRRDLAAAHTAMASVLAHARAELERVLRRDGRIDWDSMPEGADAPSMAEFTMRSLLDSLKKGDEDCAVLVVLLERGLSPPPEQQL